MLKGTNKCQCGLDVADLPHSCTLGHLHHLEADDGKTYHYLQFAQGKDTFLGHDTHFKNLEVKGRIFPHPDHIKVTQAPVLRRPSFKRGSMITSDTNGRTYRPTCPIQSEEFSRGCGPGLPSLALPIENHHVGGVTLDLNSVQRIHDIERLHTDPA